ncbi:MAG: UDP-N-acetylmuramoyl-tripeptide--D-alanyl-D-alanine ligase [Bacteroidales bacterium]|nr:UDP-N-acetylmuramoyl-tripeptide--D-alanyl-D-alanine ligase [Bacteroidales bacterium]
MKTEQLYEIFKQYPNITTDSRNVPENSIFFALKGNNFDGNKFAETALEKGAKFAVISDKNYAELENTILVKNSLQTLQELAKFNRNELNTKIFAITGSNGKTTTKELINRILSKKYKTFSTPGNFNNHIGLPLSLLSITKEIEIAVIEMGANHLGEIDELCNIALPDMGLITNIGRAHLEGFGSLENLIDTKLGLFRAIKNKNGKFLLNTNDENLSEKIQNYPNIINYGKNETSIVKCVEQNSNIYLNLKVLINNSTYNVNTKLIGSYNTDNILAAITTGIINDVPINDIITAIEEYEPSNNRSQLLKTKNNTLILDMYNANPTSMKAAILNFAEIDLPKKILFIGDMLELGENEVKEHQKIINLINEQNFEFVFIVGKIFGKCNNIKQHFHFDNIQEFTKWLGFNSLKNYSILIKASNGTGLKKCVEYL